MSSVNLSEGDWQQVMNIIGSTRDFPWTVTNPLLMKLGQQLRSQNAKGQEQREREYPEAASRGVSSPAGNSYRPERITSFPPIPDEA